MGALWGLLLASVLCIFIPGMQSAFAGVAAILFSFYIVYDTQLIMGGKHSKGQFGVDDYVFAALNLYLDVINLFIELLQIFGDQQLKSPKHWWCEAWLQVKLRWRLSGESAG